MSISSFCLEKRDREQEVLKKFLLYSLAGSIVFHTGLVLSFQRLPQQPEFIEEPIELIIVEEAQTQSQTEPELKSEPEPQVTSPQQSPPSPQPQAETPPEITTEVPTPVLPQPAEPTEPTESKPPEPKQPKEKTLQSSPIPPLKTLESQPSQTPQPLASIDSDSLPAKLNREDNSRTESFSGNNPITPGGSSESALRSAPSRTSVNSTSQAPLTSGEGCTSFDKAISTYLANEGKEPRLVVEVITDFSGKVTEAKVINSSNYPEVDQAAEATARKIHCPSDDRERIFQLAFPLADFREAVTPEEGEGEELEQNSDIPLE